MQAATKESLRRRLPGTLYYFLAELYFLPRQLLTLDFVRYVLVFIRRIYFLHIRKNLHTLDPLPENVSKNTIMHNLKGTIDMAVRRSYRLLRPVMTIDRVHYDRQNMKVLSIGPRAEGEIFNLIGHGFASRNIRGLDLISHSPYIDLGDMHAMPYDDNSFDLIFSGWVLPYSENRPQAAKEMVRVAKNGAIFAIGMSYNPMTNEEAMEKIGYIAGSEEHITKTDEVLELFKGHVDKIYFRQDAEYPEKVCALITVFSIKK